MSIEVNIYGETVVEEYDVGLVEVGDIAFDFPSFLWDLSRLLLYSVIAHKSLRGVAMSKGETILGTSRVDPRFRITLVQPIPELLKVSSGDLIVFVRDEEGKILIRASNISQVAVRG